MSGGRDMMLEVAQGRAVWPEHDLQDVNLGAVAHVEMGQSPSSAYVNDQGNGAPFLQGNAEFGHRYPSARLSCTNPAKVCQPGDMLISVRAPVGALNIADQRYCIGRGLAAVRFAGVDNVFGWYALNHWIADLQKVAQGTTFEAVSKKDLQDLRLRILPLPEQRRIAEILDTVDEAIQQTEALITKLKEMKRGLLHDLLTRGLDENGELRDPVAHPEQFKDSPLGRIPRGWEVVPLIDTAIKGGLGFTDGDWIESPWITTEGIRLVQTGNIGVGEFLDKPDSRRFISPQTFHELGCKWIHAGDILICRLADPIGRACMVPEYIGDSVTAVDCTIYRPDSKMVNRDFVLEYLNWSDHLHRVLDTAGGSTRQRISRGNLGKVLVAIPFLAEQEAAVLILKAQNMRIREEQAYRDKLDLLKHALMQDLLTGRVRVPVPSTHPETVEATA